MRIAEIFHSIQGEGELTGVPSVFIRTSGCNLRCAWCDTPYASWEPEGDDMSVAALLDTVAALPSRHVVLTGGEPMVARDIGLLAAGLRALGRHITIETAGTVPPDGIACDLASVSPKLSHSTPAPGTIEPAWIERHEARRLPVPVLRQWLDAAPYQLKFVVAEPGHLDEIAGLLAALDRAVPPDRVHLMPEGRTPAELQAKAPWVLEACKRLGYRYCHRLHIDLFGNTRGT